MKRTFEEIGKETTSVRASESSHHRDVMEEETSPLMSVAGATTGDEISHQANKKTKTESIMLYKYHKFLPSDIVANIPEESAEWKRELLENLRQFPSTISSIEGVNWEHLDYSLMLLKRYTEIKYPLSLSEKEEICAILYNILRLASQNIYGVDFSTQIKCCYALSSLLKKNETLKITFDWKVLYDILDKTYFSKFRIAAYSPREHGSSLVDLIRKLKRYFSNDSTEELLAFFRPFMCITDHKIFKAQAFLSIMLPTRLDLADNRDTFKINHYEKWVDEFFGMWDWIGLYPTWDLSFFILFANLAQDQAGYIDWEPYMEFLFTKIMKCFDLPVGNTPLPSSYEEYPSDELNLITPFDIAKNLLLANSAKLIVWMLSKNNSAMKLLKQLIKSISNFFQPSNEGQWTTKCADFLLILCTKFGKRLDIERGMKGKTFENYERSKNSGYPWIPEEFRLSEEQCVEFVRIVQPLAMTSLFSKSSQMTTCANHSLKHLAYILPQEVFPSLMERSFFALETLTNTHQTTSALETLSLVVFPLLKYSIYPEGASYLSNLLQLTLPGIDVNDTTKTFSTFKFYTSLLVCVPLFTTSISNDDRLVPDVVRIFEDWCVELLERIFNVLSHQIDPKTNQGESDIISPSMFWGLCDLLFNQMSTELLSICLKKVFNFVDNNFLFSARKNIAHMCSSLSYAYPEQTLAMFVPMLYGKLVEKDGKSLRNLTDIEMQYYLQILGQVCYRTGHHLLKFRPQLENIINLCYACDRKKIVKTCGKLFRNILRTLSKYYLSELKSINASEWYSEKFGMYEHWRSWGEFISLKEFEINWHIPSQEELKVSIELCNTYLTNTLEYIKTCVQFMRETGGNIQDLQKLKNSLIFVRYAMRGGNTLFPEFEKDELDNMSQYPNSRLVEAGLCMANKCTSLSLTAGYEQVCDVLHELCAVIFDHRSDKDPNLLGKICKVYFPMIAMRGGNTRYRYKKKKSSHEFVKQHSYKDVYSRTPNKYPRYLLLIQALLEYKVRCVIHNESLPYTKYHERLLGDLLRLSLHSYSEVRKRAQSVLMSCINKFSDKVIKSFLPKVIDALADKNSSDEQRTGTIFILEKPFAVSSVIRDWDLCSKFLMALCQTSHIEKQSIQQRLAQLFETYFNAFYHVQIASNQEKEKYSKLIYDVTELAKSNGGWHWKYHTLVTSFLMLMIRPDQPYPIEPAKFMLRQMTSDLEKTRIIACEAVNLILCYFKPVQPKKMVQPMPRTKDNSIDWTALGSDMGDEATWKKANFYEKNFFGWYTIPDSFPVYDYQKPADCSRQELLRSELFPIVSEDDFVQKLIDIFSVGDEGFNESNSQLFKGMFQIFPCKENQQGILDLLKPAIQSALIPTIGTGRPEEVHHTAMLAEIVGGLIRGMKHWDYNQQVKTINEFIIPEILEKVLDKCSMNCISEICEGFEFAVCDKDTRRVGWLLKYIAGKTKQALEKKDSDADNNYQIRYLRYLYSIIGETCWRAPNELQQLLEDVFSQSLSHHSEHVREYVSLFLSITFKSLWNPKRTSDHLASFKVLNQSYDELQYDFLRKFTKNVYQEMETKQTNVKAIANAQSNVIDSPVYSDFKNYSKTILGLFASLFNSNSPHCGIGEIMNNIKLIAKIYEHSTSHDDDLQVICQNDIIILSGFPYSSLLSKGVIDFLYDEIVTKESGSFTNWSIRSSLLECLQIFAYRQQFVLEDRLEKLFTIIITMLNDNQLEVRQMAAITLSGFLKISKMEYSQKLIPQFQEKSLKKKHVQSRDKTVTSTYPGKDTTERHAGVLGLSAIALAFPYSVPDFIPDLLCFIAKFSNDNIQSIRETVKKTFQEFIKCHSDMWQIHKLKFTDEQLVTLHDLFQTSSPSYYA